MDETGKNQGMMIVSIPSFPPHRVGLLSSLPPAGRKLPKRYSSLAPVAKMKHMTFSWFRIAIPTDLIQGYQTNGSIPAFSRSSPPLASSPVNHITTQPRNSSQFSPERRCKQHTARPQIIRRMPQFGARRGKTQKDNRNTLQRGWRLRSAHPQRQENTGD